MSRKLPLFSEVFARPSDVTGGAKKPSVDAARTRLGGRPSDAPAPNLPPGTPVTFMAAGGLVASGVVLWASTREAHVMLDGSRLKRVAPDDLVQVDAAPPGELAKIAGDARMFAMLAEGQAVRYADAQGTVRDGNVVEKCRYGALVLRGDGAVVAVGFRKLFPAPTVGVHGGGTA